VLVAELLKDHQGSLQIVLALGHPRQVESHEPGPEQRLGQRPPVARTLGRPGRLDRQLEAAVVVLMTAPQLAQRTEKLRTRPPVARLAPERQRGLEVGARGVELPQRGVRSPACRVQPHPLGPGQSRSRPGGQGLVVSRDGFAIGVHGTGGVAGARGVLARRCPCSAWT
jgi:hypothetical protein